MTAFLGAGEARTYVRAAAAAGVSVSTIKTHLRRIRVGRPGLYDELRAVREAQLAQRHREAMQNARDHSRAYFRRKRNWEFKQVYGYYPWQVGL